jgi:hypothetical protein
MKRTLAVIALIAAASSAAFAAGWKHYTDATLGWSIGYAPGMTVDPGYVNETMGPGHTIKGVAFHLPASLVSGTNLHDDSALSVESLPGSNCTPGQFVDPAENLRTIHADHRVYRAADSGDAGAGNRYETQIFVIKGTCIAVRYFLHYSAIENYDPGAVKAFDAKTIAKLFDRMRASLMLTK